MKIACLQFAPQVGDVDNNLNRADSILNKTKASDLEGLDLLVLPELAFSGYNYQSLQHITPFLEPPGSGISSLWARTTALKYDCAVVVGYPEKVDVRAQWPASPEYYNSVLVVNGDGDTVANYRKSHLYYTDETWALEGKDGFYHGEIPGVGDTVLGIGMDLNPYKFEAQWDAFEFGFHAVAAEANVVVLTMAWNTEQDTRLFSRRPTEPDLQTLVYWVQRLEPLIRAEREGEVIVVCCNRTGSEDDVMYAGTSAVIGILAGEVYVYGVLGRGVKELLVVDTDNLPLSKLTDAINVETEYSYVEDMGEEFGTAEAADQLPQAVSSEVTMIEEDALQQEAPPPATPQEEDDDEDDLGPLPSSSISQFPPSDLRGDDRVKNLRSQLKLMIPTGPCINDPTTIETAIDEDDDDDDVIIDSPGVTNPPSPVQPMKLPKLTIPSSPWRFRRKPSPYPWQYKDGGGSQVFGGGKVCMTPVTPFDTGSPMVSAKSGPQSALSWRPTQAISYIIGSPIPENEVAVAGSFKHNSRKSSRQSSLERRFKIDLFSPDSPRAFEPPRKKVANKLDTMAVVAVGGGSEGAAASESIPHATTASDQQCKVEIIDNEQDAAVGEEEEPQSPVAAANLSELSAVLEGLRLAQGRPVSEISIPNLPPPLCEPAQNPCPDRPFSPKSHNASRNHSRNTTRDKCVSRYHPHQRQPERL
ncbi:carbon-nitrogen hydrolase [Apodospora peruviana]|uniref:Carbon-nitrogen hydrolase n=1 Tax=Apodospora peruviana TaxID=516989 RepID=A0AAE0ILE1_9PEZI|nr:carbon-nitrogen hydrolase [Apodospora peruviana]